jgi:acetyl-CoA acetyltransferase
VSAAARPTGALSGSRPVHVIGVGLHPYRRSTDTPYVHLGLTAVRAALDDAGIGWNDVDSATTATVNVGFAAGRTMLRYLGATGIPMQQVENASASGSTALRLACLEVATGISDVALAVGVDKVALPNMAPTKTGISDLVGSRMLPFTHFALLADAYLHRWDLPPEVLGRVAVKNHANGSANPAAQRQKVRTLDEVMAEPIAGALTRLQGCPVGEGAAAVLVASPDAMERLSVDPGRSPRVRASVARSEQPVAPGENWDIALTRATTRAALGQAGIGPDELDVVEVHDAFSIEELLYLEAMGLCAEGEAGPLLEAGAWDIGGRCAISASGGLLAMGHPLGPTGVGQVAEITRQLRGEAGSRQHPGAQVGLAHMVGVGAVCVVHVLSRT